MKATKEYRYFHGDIQLVSVTYVPRKEIEPQFPGFPFKRADSFSIWVGRAEPKGPLLPVDRMIYFNLKGKNHVCDHRCLNAKGSNWECSCGGVNHGAGSPVMQLSLA